MLGQALYTAFIALTGLERLYEVRVSNRNVRWSFEQGGIEIGKGHYPFMVILHTGFLIACVAEVWLIPRDVSILWASIFFVLAILSQAFRWWCIRSLKEQWNTRIILVPGLKRIIAGPYKYFPHPNYIIVAIEGLIIPLFYKAYFSAIAFTILNAGLMWVRIRAEEKALREFLIKEQA